MGGSGMSSRIFQSLIVQMKEATDRCMGVIDSDGFVIACSDLSMIGSKQDDFSGLTDDDRDAAVTTSSRTYKFLGAANSKYDYAVFAEGNDSAAVCICVLASVAFNEAKTNYEEKHSKSAFLKSIISDNILPGDIYVRAKEMHFVADAPRAVILVRQTEKPDVSGAEVLQKLFPNSKSNFVLNINETDIVIIKELAAGSDPAELDALAQTIINTVNNELQIKAIVGIGSVAKHIRELADRYKEAQIAIEISKVFDTEKAIIRYENLGIARIVYQLPTTLCEMFLSEVFKKKPIEALDRETLYTINKFFENNLNVSETSRKLFVHRNTLVYRLEKIKKLTGLDLREFDHAIVFKVALMVKKYLASQNARH